MRVLQQGKAAVLYTAFLNTGGRIIHDAFIHTVDNGSAVLLDTPTQGFQEVKAHVLRYKLRAALSVDDVTPEWRVWVKLPASGEASPNTGESALWTVDPRLPALGHRAVLPATQSLLAHWTEPAASYDLHRMRLGVAETAAELSGELPLECNLEGLQGVSFSKGCYIGQELTSRTHFRGVIRKRIMPVTFASPAAAAQHVKRGDSVMGADDEATPAGRVLACHSSGECGLALLRLDSVQKPQRHRVVSDAGLSVDVVVHTPQWWPQAWQQPGNTR